MMAPPFRFLLVITASSFPLGHSFRWRRRISPSCSCRGGSSDGYNFRYDDDENDTNKIKNNDPIDHEQTHLPNDLPPPPLPPYDQSNGRPPPLPDFPYNDGVDYSNLSGAHANPEHFATPLEENSNYPPYPPESQQQQSHGMEPPPPHHYGPQQQQQQYSPPPPPPPAEFSASEQQETWDTTTSDTMIEDLSSFDKEYILKGLSRLYRKKILPLELSSRYGHFHSPPLSPSDFDAPPMILLLGQYSVGKTSFVKYLLGRDFPGIRVGPEPTTDRFTAVLWGHHDKIVPGAALCSQSDRPFTGLSPFGNQFLSRLEGTELNAPVLRNVTIIDTPGILSGLKQRARNYDYEAVMKWFAERADLIIVMFDAHKLDISDELKSVLQLMTPHSDKIRIVLNKADSISTQQLLRVYGALMWSLGKVLNTPEVSRVYLGSFWNAPLQNADQAELLEREELDLLHDIMALPQHAVMRRINELVKRARSVKVHAYVIHYLRKQLKYTLLGKREKQRKLIAQLEREFMAAARRYGLPKGDFPSLEPMRQALSEIKDLTGFLPQLDKKLIREMDKVFSADIPELLERAKNH